MMMNSLGVVSPGQGSQHVGMGWNLYRSFKAAREIFSKSGKALSQDIFPLCFKGPKETLDMTENTQVAVLIKSRSLKIAFQGNTRELLKKQLIFPVRWKETIEKMVQMGIDTIVELGPKKVLS